MAYGCIFCQSGKEDIITRGINLLWPDLRVSPLRQVKRKTVNRQTTREETILFPGYIFFEADRDASVNFRLDGVIRLLRTDDGHWQLSGSDASFAKWVLNMNGLITFSTAFQEGDRIRFIEGPLKDFEGSVIKVDRRNRNGLVEIVFNQTVHKVWMGFDLVERVDNCQTERQG